MTAIVLCAKPNSDHLAKDTSGCVIRPCHFCKADLVVSPSTQRQGDKVTLACNDCGKAAVMLSVAKHPETPVELGILPGALAKDVPDDRRRRNELEARGFRQMTQEEVEEIL